MLSKQHTFNTAAQKKTFS